MKRATAERVIQGLVAASGTLNETVRLVQAEAPDVFQEYRKRCAEAIAAIYKHRREADMDQTGAQSVSWLSLVDRLRAVQLASGPV
jgi:hypothetical protein